MFVYDGLSLYRGLFHTLYYYWPEKYRSLYRGCSFYGIRDLAKIRCGIREKGKYLDGILDLTATRETGFAKIWARDATFFCLSAGNSRNRHEPSKRSSGKTESTRREQNINRKGQSAS